MTHQQPTITTAGPRPRQFAAFAVAVQAIVVNQAEEMLLLNSPTRKQGWQLVSGALEAGETLLDGTLRELHEELGADIQVRPLGTVHTQTFHYDQNVPHMLAIYSLFTYQDGKIEPGDDMTGSQFRWWSLPELNDPTQKFHVTVMPWMLKRAIDLHHLWNDQPDSPLQPRL